MPRKTIILASILLLAVAVFLLTQKQYLFAATTLIVGALGLISEYRNYRRGDDDLVVDRSKGIPSASEIKEYRASHRGTSIERAIVELQQTENPGENAPRS